MGQSTKAPFSLCDPLASPTSSKTFRVPLATYFSLLDAVFTFRYGQHSYFSCKTLLGLSLKVKTLNTKDVGSCGSVMIAGVVFSFVKVFGQC